MAASLVPGSGSPQAKGEGAREYLLDMIQQLARIARRSGEMAVAIHLEAILAARRHEVRRDPD